jgi:hypothetical protein
MLRLMSPDVAEEVMVLETSIWDTWKACVANNHDEATGKSWKAALDDKLPNIPRDSLEWAIVPILDG